MAKAVILVALVLLASGCTQSGATVSYDEQIKTLATPESAARDYAAKTYFNTDSVSYSGFSYSTKMIDDDSAEMTITFTRILDAPSYTLTRVMEQKITLEKRDNAWEVASTPPARIISESYD